MSMNVLPAYTHVPHMCPVPVEEGRRHPVPEWLWVAM